MWSRNLGLAAAATMLAATLTTAQDRPRQNPPPGSPDRNPPLVNPAQNPPGRPLDQRPDEKRLAKPGASSQLDAALANCLVLGNQEEVALSQWALERIQNPQVKEFAQQLVNEHQQALSKLKPFASYDGGLNSVASRQMQENRVTINADRPVSPPDDTNRLNPNDPSSRLSQNLSPRPDSQRVANESTIHDQLFDVEKTAKEECLRLTKECLSKLQGQEFDNGFVGMQIGAHIGMMAKLNAAESAASPELQKIIDEAQAVTKRHQDHAAKLMDDLKNSEAHSRPVTR